MQTIENDTIRSIPNFPADEHARYTLVAMQLSMIKARLINLEPKVAIISDFGHHPCEYENMGLQFRKILEHFAYAFLLLNEGAYTATKNVMEAAGKPKKFLRAIRSIQPDFFPEAFRSVPSNVPGMGVMDVVKGGLDAEIFFEWYDLLSSQLIHGINPLAPKRNFHHWGMYFHGMLSAINITLRGFLVKKYGTEDFLWVDCPPGQDIAISLLLGGQQEYVGPTPTAI